jgi:hypothetical protein
MKTSRLSVHAGSWHAFAGWTTESKRQRAGITLIEVVAYIGGLTLVTALAFGAFYKYWDQSKLMSRQADDIVRALHAGEQWRDDIRKAIGPIEVEMESGSHRLHIPQVDGEVVFLFQAGEMWRYQTNNAREREVRLILAKSSEFIVDSNRYVPSWRWEFELPARQKKARLLPLFTFLAVPGGRVGE